MSNYKINEVEYPSVTTVIGILGKGDALLQSSVNCATNYIKDNIFRLQPDVEHKREAISIEELLIEAKTEWKNIKDEAMNIGTEVHKMIENHIKSIINKTDMPKYEGEYRKEVENGYLAFLEWEKENITKWIASEKTVICKEFGYAGTLDAIAELKDGVYYIDFKSSKGFYDGYDKQISAYKYADGEYPDAGIGVLRLDKETGIPEWKDYSKKYDKAINSFHKLVDFYYSDKKRRLKNNPFVK